MLLTVAFEKQIIGSFGHNDEFPIVLSYLKDKRFNAEPMISKKIKLENIVTEGFQELIDNKDRNIKILVSP
jgi:(R,R)-butanediol dehydrogenase/meso-butanediol dehydrogenase/diacetyl reductase